MTTSQPFAEDTTDGDTIPARFQLREWMAANPIGAVGAGMVTSAPVLVVAAMWAHVISARSGSFGFAIVLTAAALLAIGAALICVGEEVS